MGSAERSENVGTNSDIPDAPKRFVRLRGLLRSLAPDLFGIGVFLAVIVLGYVQLWSVYASATDYPTSLVDDSSIMVHTGDQDSKFDTYVSFDEDKGVTVSFKLNDSNVSPEIRVMVIFAGNDFQSHRESAGPSPNEKRNCAVGLSENSEFQCVDSKDGKMDVPDGFMPFLGANSTLVYGKVSKAQQASGFTIHPEKKFYSSNGATTYFSLPRVGTDYCLCVTEVGKKLTYASGGSFFVAYTRAKSGSPGQLGPDESLTSVAPQSDAPGRLMWSLLDASKADPWLGPDWNGLGFIIRFGREIQPSGVIANSVTSEEQSRLIFILGVVAAVIPGAAAGAAKFVRLATKTAIGRKRGAHGRHRLEQGE
ncbi:hypothetical protein [Sinomonas sp. B1-1]|uniref:hypothetical protein n=1 Tax=Sinomonas sp. B1-1 TaxID=3141454 RepID=UPI003D2E3F8D